MAEYKKITITYNETLKEYFCVIDKEDEQERFWLIGRTDDLEELVQKIRHM